MTVAREMAGDAFGDGELRAFAERRIEEDRMAARDDHGWEVVAMTRNRLPGERPVRIAGPFDSWAAALDDLAQFGPMDGSGAVRRVLR